MMHDCISGAEEPLYGFATLLMTNETSLFNSSETCTNTEITNTGGLQNSGFGEDQNIFDVSNLPTGRLNKYSAQSRTGKLQHYQSDDDYTSRQTGEGFESIGRPRCRLRRDPSNRCMNTFLLREIMQ